MDCVDGDEQVYVVPTSGGEPRQLTFYPAKGPLAPRWGWDNQVFGWSKDGKRIIFRSLRDSWSLPIARLFTVSVDGGPSTPLPMPTYGFNIGNGMEAVWGYAYPSAKVFYSAANAGFNAVRMPCAWDSNADDTT